MQKILQLANRHKLLIFILVVAAVSRLWNVGGFLDFKGDEGRDLRVVSRFIKDFDLMFIGPRTSIGDMYLGPLYYYLISPALLLANFSPVGPAIFICLIGVATVFLVWRVAKEWFGKTASVVAASLYAISPVVIENSRDSWNPNVMPFFSLITMYSFWRALTAKNYKWLFVSSVSFAFALQSHYLGLLLLPTLGIMWALTFWKQPVMRGRLLKYSVLSLVLFAILMSPIFIFDLKHNNQNINSFIIFFTHRQDTVSAKPWNAIPELWPLWHKNVATRIVLGKQTTFGLLFPAVILAGVIFALYKSFKSKQNFKEAEGAGSVAYVAGWLLIGMIGLALLKQTIFDHYFGFLYPAIFLLIGFTVQSLWKTKFKKLTTAALIILIFFSIKNAPLLGSPGNDLGRTKELDRKIVEESGGRRFNFGLVAQRNYDEGYLYFFELWKAPVTQADPQHLGETVTDQLFVVCENPCTPSSSPKAEIAHFGMSKVEQEWTVAGYKVYKLIHSDGKQQ